MHEIGVGIVGTGFMGKAHALAYRAVGGIFLEAPRSVRLKTVADISETAAEQAARQFGFQGWTTDWRSIVDDPDIHIVSITTPNILHRDIAVAAAKAGKHIHCEKPLAPTATEAKEMLDAADAAGVVTQVGYNYIKNPVLKLARDMIAAGELGEIMNFRGIHAEDYMSNPDSPYTWRLDKSGGPGVIADLGSHIIGMAHFLLGPVGSVNADLETVIKTRPVAAGASERRAVEVDDIARLTVRFARGCSGTIEANWVATGQKMQLGFEVTGTRGSLIFSQERLNELQYYRADANPQHAGFTRILSGPQHSPYGLFCVAPGHQLGFNDLKTIEVADFLSAIGGGERHGPDFREAWEIQKIVEAAVKSSRKGSWQQIE